MKKQTEEQISRTAIEKLLLQEPVEIITYSRKTAAIALGVSERFFDGVAKDLGIPSFKLGSCRRFRKTDIQAAINREFAAQNMV